MRGRTARSGTSLDANSGHSIPAGPRREPQVDRELLSADELDRAAAALDADWTVGPERLERTVEFPSFLVAVEFIGDLAPVAERLAHHPDLSLSWRTVKLRLSTHSAGGVTAFDVELARDLDQIIARLTG